jgi:hypothetical protein
MEFRKHFYALGPTMPEISASKVAMNTTSGGLVMQCIFFLLNVKAYNLTYLTLRIQCITVGTFKGKHFYKGKIALIEHE